MSSSRERLSASNSTALDGVRDSTGSVTRASVSHVAAPRPWHPIDVTQVTLGGEFARRVRCIIEANILRVDVDKTFLASFQQDGAVENGPSGAYTGCGKFIDALVRLAAGTNDARLLTLKKKVIAGLIATQGPDGYIGVFADPRTRVESLWDVHEAAYLIWGLVTDYSLFREERSLNAARRLADYFLDQFAARPDLRIDKPYDVTFEVADIGWDRALLALSEASGSSKYRNFVTDVLRLGEYDPPIHCGTTSFANHAYAHLSHCLAQLDLFRQSGNARLLRTSKKALDFLRKRDGMLVTGSCSRWECWHDDQDGSDNASETCAAAYLARLMEALLQIEGESLYGDILERDIYNALFSATAPDGARTRYYTPFQGMRSYDEHNYACCANNNRRFLADLGSWVYYRTETGVAINLYNASVAKLTLNTGMELRVEQQTDYPSSGTVLVKVDPASEADFELRLRIPRWCRAARLSINGSTYATVPGGQYYPIKRAWRPGDVVELDMPMEWRFVRGRRSQEGRAAILRGPLIFTFNPARNAEAAAPASNELGLLKINPREIGGPIADNSIRPDGISCEISAWAPHAQPWPFVPRIPVVLTEYADPGGQQIYFSVPGEGLEILADDELV